MTHVYAVLVFGSGYRRVEVMSKAQVDAVRAMSRAANAPAWTGSYLEMAKKTVMHRILKTAPLRPGARAILDRDPDFDFSSGSAVSVQSVPRAALADRLRQKRLGTTQEADAGVRADTGRAEAAGADGDGSGDPSPEPAAASAACAHPDSAREATPQGLVCSLCGTVLASYDGDEAEAPKPAPRPRSTKTKAKGTKEPKAPLQPGDEGYGNARAHAVAGERGLDHDAVHRIAFEVLIPDDGLIQADEFSVKRLEEDQWAEVIAAIAEAPVRVEDSEPPWMDVATEFAGRMVVQAGLGTEDDPWTAGDPLAAEMFGIEASELTPAQWVEFGIRVAARHPLP